MVVCPGSGRKGQEHEDPGVLAADSEMLGGGCPGRKH